MKHFRITEQPLNNKKKITYIVDSESIEEVVKYNEETEDGWLDGYENDRYRFDRILKNIQDNDGVFYVNEDREFICIYYFDIDDEYTSKLTEVTITELTEKQ